MIQGMKSRRSRFAAGAAALIFLTVGCGSPHIDANEIATNSATAASPSAAASSAPAPSSTEQADAVRVMEASLPVSFAIPALERTGDIIETGLRKDNTLEVPPDHEGAPASWYTGSPTPGEVGASVLLGHVNSTEDESGVFYNLEALKNGDQIEVARKDGSTAVFEVYKSELYPKDDFPTKAVYFPVDDAELRLITCDGFTESTGEFVDNLVVYATLVATN